MLQSSMTIRRTARSDHGLNAWSGYDGARLARLFKVFLGHRGQAAVEIPINWEHIAGLKELHPPVQEPSISTRWTSE